MTYLAARGEGFQGTPCINFLLWQIVILIEVYETFLCKL
jgi:hypothetical protein